MIHIFLLHFSGSTSIRSQQAPSAAWQAWKGWPVSPAFCRRKPIGVVHWLIAGPAAKASGVAMMIVASASGPVGLQQIHNRLIIVQQRTR